jgi:beta-mannanase
MNLPNFKWSVSPGGNTAESYVDAWRRLRSIFSSENASNVTWVWCPNVIEDKAINFSQMYPGDAYVDWLGLDGYNWATSKPWRSFTELFDESYRAITSLSDKPLVIAEWGCTEAGGNKGEWLESALSSEIPSMPRIKAVVYFNQNYEEDWRIESSARARRGYADGMSAPFYRTAWP